MQVSPRSAPCSALSHAAPCHYFPRPSAVEVRRKPITKPCYHHEACQRPPAVRSPRSRSPGSERRPPATGLTHRRLREMRKLVQEVHNRMACYSFWILRRPRRLTLLQDNWNRWPKVPCGPAMCKLWGGEVWMIQHSLPK